jgi:class 3 adenylate cyclase
MWPVWPMLQRHDDLLFPVIRVNGGSVVKTIGDAIMARFDKPNSRSERPSQCNARSLQTSGVSKNSSRFIFELGAYRSGADQPQSFRTSLKPRSKTIVFARARKGNWRTLLRNSNWSGAGRTAMWRNWKNNSKKPRKRPARRCASSAPACYPTSKITSRQEQKCYKRLTTTLN